MKTTTLVLFTCCLLIAGGCSSSSRISSLSLLTGNAWELAALSGKAIDAEKFPGKTPALTFLEGGRLSGFAGCNNFSGTYSVDQTSLLLSPGVMTKMACPGTGESELITALTKVTGYQIGKEKLTLMAGTTELMSFVPKKG